MKKIFLVLLFFAVQVRAEGELKSFETKGSLRVRTQADQNTDFANIKDYSIVRIRGDLTFRPDKNLRVFVQPQFSKYFGQIDYAPSSTTANTATTTSSGLYDSTMILHQGYFEYSVTEDLKVLAGRSILSYGDELVLGVNDWNNVGRSFDVFKIRYQYGLGYSDLFTSKINDTTISSSNPGDNDFYGFYNAWKTESFVKNIDLYALYSRDARSGIPLDLDLWSVGTRLKSEMGDFDYRIEVTAQTGTITQVSTTGGQADAEFGYKISNLRLALEAFTSSDKYNQIYPTAHKWLGYEDVLSRRNLTGGVVHLLVPVMENVKAEFNYHTFMRTANQSSVYKFTGAALGTASGSTANDVGSELDFTLKHKTNDNFMVQTGASLFQPGQYLKDQNLNISPVFFYLQAEAIF